LLYFGQSNPIIADIKTETRQKSLAACFLDGNTSKIPRGVENSLIPSILRGWNI